MKDYNHLAIEKKWQKEWAKKKAFRTTDPSTRAKHGTGQIKKKFYILDMFPYVSGEGIHVGHPKGYIATDIVSRMKRMQGFNVLHPMGFDAFGLPAENFAIKTKTNPMVFVKKSVSRFKKQLEVIGFDYDWSREVNTSDPKFYKWTQWIFLKLLEKGLAYESNEPVNWCPVDKTILANEDVENGKCERCGATVEKRPIRQWVLKITNYADRLLSDLDGLDWSESIKESQRNWIGRSEGMLFTAPVKDSKLKIQTFSAHFEAFVADTFVVIAPDHSFLKELVKNTPKEKEVLNFAEKLVNERAELGYENKELKGIFTGRYIIDPVGNGDLPIWVASYALADYGTGIVKCSAHDDRDFAFAKKYKISLKPVLFPRDNKLADKVKNLEICFTDMKQGILSEPSPFRGAIAGNVREDIIKYLQKNNLAEKKTTYKLHDWVFSRQRYWGEPIPVLHDGEKIVPVAEKDLPVKLPKVKSYEPTGTAESPLANIPKWMNVRVGKKILRRESNTMPQWAGSSWYYLRYMDPLNNKSLVDKKKEKYWNEVDLYVGGAEHATRHLIYARFWHKFLYDIGAVSTKEPFRKLQHVGLIMASDGRKMSKRWGNVINPDDIIFTYGADALRMYEMFMGPFDQSVAWGDKNIVGVRRFLERVWRLAGNVSRTALDMKPKMSKAAFDTKIETLLHKTIKKVSDDIQNMAFNTAVSAMMILVNEMESAFAKSYGVAKKDFELFLKILSPFAPHMTEEIWHFLGHKTFLSLEPWPKADVNKMRELEVRMVVQINGRVRAIFMAVLGASQDEVTSIAKGLPEVGKWLLGKEIKKVIFVFNKLVNFVTN